MKVDSTQLQLEDMPVEVLSNIFEFLDGDSLKSSRLVSNKWNQIISKSPKLMKKFVLVIDGDRETEFHQFSKFSRCYQQIKIESLENYKITKNLLKVLREIGSKIKEAKIWNCKISSEFENLIRCFPSADHVKFVECVPLGVPKCFNFDPEVFAACKSLEVSCYPTGFFCFENLQLTKLIYWLISSPDWQHLIDFIAKQTRLTSLNLDIFGLIPSEVDLDHHLDKMKCPVKYLLIRYICGQLSPKLLEFLNLFGMTVKSLEVTSFRFTGKPFALLDSITSSFKSLTHLTLKGFIFTKKDSNLELLKPIETVKTMELEEVGFITSEEFSNFFKLFAQLAEIKLHSNIHYDFLQCFFKLQHVKKFIFVDSNWKEKDFCGDFVVLKNKLVSIGIGKRTRHGNHDNIQRAFYLALKIVNEMNLPMNLPKDELMMTVNKAQESSEWKPVTEEYFQAMDKENFKWNEIFCYSSVIIQKH